MTWLEIMDVLDKMPRHLLKEDAELWHYDGTGKTEVLPVANLVSPLNDSEPDSDEWKDGGCYHLSLQSFDEGRIRPRLEEYTVKLRRTCDVSVMAEDTEQAQRIGEALAAKESAWVYQQMQEAMAGCGDEFFGVGAAQEYCDFAMTADECKRILGE